MIPYSGTKTSQDLPLPARLLEIAGIVPFAIGALGVGLAPEIKSEAAHALLLYGAVSLSFLGGIRWGFALLEGEEAGWSAYGLSIAPALAGWLGAASGGPGGMLILAIALGIWLFAERAAPPSLPLPRGYIRLRGALTAVAILSLVAAALYW